jgi:hypothetical protein
VKVSENEEPKTTKKPMTPQNSAVDSRTKTDKQATNGTQKSYLKRRESYPKINHRKPTG